MDIFEDFAVEMDGECLHQDFDAVDLYGEKMIEDEDDGFGDDISFE